MRREVRQQVETALAEPGAAVHTANYIAVFTMFILQEMLIDLSNNPVTNFNNIIAIANAISSLNSSVKPIP